MDATSPLIRPASAPDVRFALAAGAGVATVSLAGVSLVASAWHNDGRLPYYAAEAVCGAGLCASLLKLQSLSAARRRIAHAQTQPSAHFNLALDRQQVDKLAAAMAGVSGVMGAVAVGVGAAGKALELPTLNNLFALSVGGINIAVAIAHAISQRSKPACVVRTAPNDALLEEA